MGERIAVLHIGHPKTGSSSIQYALAGYDDGSTFYATFKDPNHSHAIGTAFHSDLLNYNVYKKSGISTEEAQRRRKQYRAQFSVMLKRRDRNRIIVSGEDIWGLQRTDKKKLIEFIRQYGWKVYVIAYVREPASWAASRLSERVKSGGGIPDKMHAQYRCGLAAFMDLLPPVCLHVRPFGDNVIADFCQTFGLNLSKMETSRRNESLSLPAMKLLLRFNRLGILSQYDPELAIARTWFAEAVREKYAGMESLDPALCAGLTEYSETEWLFESFGIDFRKKAPPDDTKASLETVLDNLDGVDLSGIDECLATYSIRYENFPTVELKLQRLFYVFLTLAKGMHLFKNPGINLAKSFHYRALDHLSKYRFLGPTRRKALAQAATEIRESWITGASSR